MRAVFFVAGCLLLSLITGAQPHNAALPAAPAISETASTAIIPLRDQIIAGKTVKEIRASWEPALSNFKKVRKKYLIYAE